MITCHLNGTHDTMDAIYDAIQQQLQLPPHFGRNLDALWDVLTLDVSGPIEFIWKDHNWARGKLGPVYDQFLSLLHDVERARPDFRLELS